MIDLNFQKGTKRIIGHSMIIRSCVTEKNLNWMCGKFRFQDDEISGKNRMVTKNQYFVWIFFSIMMPDRINIKIVLFINRMHADM